MIDFCLGVPVVRFSNGIEAVISKETCTMEEDDIPVVSFTQIPLKLAWAISIHKSQGCTISLAVINFKNIFEYSQAYVALSRVKDLDGLYIKNLDFGVIKCHPRAREYYKKLELSMYSL